MSAHAFSRVRRQSSVQLAPRMPLTFTAGAVLGLVACAVVGTAVLAVLAVAVLL